MRTSHATALALAAALVFSVSCSPGEGVRAADASIKEEGKRKASPDFTLKDSNGKPVTLSEYKGKVVLLNFWATWCGPCKIEIPWFVEFEQKFKDRGFAVLGVSMDEEGWDVVRPYLQQHKINYRVMVGTEEVGTAYGGVDSLPTTFILDREGRIAATHVGLVSKSVYQNDIQQLLDTAKTAAPGGAPAQRSAQ